MSMHRSRTPHELRTLAGQIPTTVAAAAIAGAVFFTATAMAQQNQPSKPKAGDVRNPMSGGGESQVKVSDHNTIDLHVKDEDLSNVLELLSIQTERNIVVSKNVSARVTASLYGVTFYEALDALLHVNGFGYIEEGNFIFVYTGEELKAILEAQKKRVAKVIHLNYLNADDAKTFAEPLLSADGGQIQINKKAEQFKLNDTTPSGGEDYALGATMVVIDYEENIDKIVELMKEIDTQPSQVLVQATILQTALNEANAFGVDFSIIGDLKFSDFMSPLDAFDGLQSKGTADNQGTAITGTPGNTSGPGTFKVGIIADNVSIFVRLLDEVNDTTILSNPKLLCLNRQPSRVLVGRRVGYLSSTTTDTATTQTVQFLDTGTQLNFRPFVSDNGRIRMELKPQVSEAIIRDSTDVSGGVVSIPDEVTQELSTNIIVGDGQTIVLGGLFRESTQYTRRQVPVLGDLPIVGAAFRGHDDTVDRSEIIFMITPTIVNDTLIATAADRAKEDAERMRTGARQGLLPFSRTKMTASLNLEAEHLARQGHYNKAMWKLSRSLSLDPNQPDAYRLREWISGKMERWPDPSMLNYELGSEIADRMHAIPQPSTPPKNWWPAEGFYVPEEKVPGHPANQPKAEPKPADTEMPAEKGAFYDEKNDSWPTDKAEGNTEQADASEPTPAEPKTADAAPTPAQPAQPAGQVATDTKPADAQPSTEPGEPTAAADQNQAETKKTMFVTPDPEVVSQVMSMQKMLRGQIDIYTFEHYDKRPTLDAQAGWKDLIDAELISAPPVNQWVGGQFATLVVTGDGPDTEFQTDHGWIYNPQSGKLWAAGFDADGKPLPKPVGAVAQATPKTVTFSVTNEPIGKVMQRLATHFGRNIVADDNVTGMVTVSLKDATFQQAMKAVLTPQQMTYVDDGNGTVRVKAPADTTTAKADDNNAAKPKDYSEMSFEEWLAAVKNADAKKNDKSQKKDGEVVGVDTESDPK